METKNKNNYLEGFTSLTSIQLEWSHQIATTDTTTQMPRFWTDNYKTHDSEECDCETCKRYKESNNL